MKSEDGAPGHVQTKNSDPNTSSTGSLAENHETTLTENDVPKAQRKHSTDAAPVAVAPDRTLVGDSAVEAAVADDHGQDGKVSSPETPPPAAAVVTAADSNVEKKDTAPDHPSDRPSSSGGDDHTAMVDQQSQTPDVPKVVDDTAATAQGQNSCSENGDTPPTPLSASGDGQDVQAAARSEPPAHQAPHRRRHSLPISFCNVPQEEVQTILRTFPFEDDEKVPTILNEASKDNSGTSKPHNGAESTRKTNSKASKAKKSDEADAKEDGGKKNEVSEKEKEDAEEERKKAQKEREDTAYADFVASNLFGSDPETMEDDSASRREWLRQKKENNEENRYLDLLMTMVGLEQVKARFLAIKAIFEAAKRRDESPDNLRLHMIILGKGGTGKSTVARLYEGFLKSIQATTPSVTDTKFKSSEAKSEEAAEPLRISIGHGDDYASKYLADRVRLEQVYILKLTSATKLKSLAKHGDVRWRLLPALRLPDYLDEELLQILIRLLKKLSMEVEGGYGDPCLRVLITRVSRSRESDTFENVRTLKGELEKVRERQALRLRDERRQRQQQASPPQTAPVGNRAEDVAKKEEARTETLEDADEKGQESPVEQPREVEDSTIQATKEGGEDAKENALDEEMLRDRFLTKADILGPEPADLRETSTAWARLQKLTGLADIKDEIDELFGRARMHYAFEIQGKKPVRTSLNRLFLGPPGTGKTTVARLYGQVIAELGLVSLGAVVEANASDLITRHVGESEEKTAALLASAQGKVLIIDEAHNLYTGSNYGIDSSDKSTSLRRRIIDTMVSKISNAPDENRCVILVGYRDRLEEMLRKSNPGLQRRFPLEDAVVFDDFSDDRLGEILSMKVAADGFQASEEGMRVARDVLSRMRTRPNFGNGGDVENVLSKAKARWRKRQRALPKHCTDWPVPDLVLEAADFDPDYDRASRANANTQALFEGFVGFEKVIKQFRDYQKMAAGMKRHNMDPRPHVPWAFVFKGPPGTGKTSTAKKIGCIYYDMGFLSNDEVINCSVTDLVGSYKGQTGPKVLYQLDRALGKVLFIDEAYRLTKHNSDSSSFQDEAVGELVDAMTKLRYFQKVVIVLAGYTQEMERLMDSNPGLRSRFSAHVEFPHLDAEGCFKHLKDTLEKLKIRVTGTGPGDGKRSDVLSAFRQLSETQGWANARDVETLANKVSMSVFIKEASDDAPADQGTLSATIDEVLDALYDMLRERRGSEMGLASLYF